MPNRKRMSRSSWRARILVSVCVAVLATAAPAAGAERLLDIPVRRACTGVDAFESVTYTASPDRGGPRDRYVATLRNEGLCSFEYGNPYRMAVRKDGRWQPLRFGRNCAFTMEAYTLPPGGSASQRIGWLGSRCQRRTLEPGRYRVSKSISTKASPVAPSRSLTVHAYFRVTHH